MSLLGTSEANAGNTYDYASSCPSKGYDKAGKGTADAWGFYLCECVSYAASKLTQNGVAFKNSYTKSKNTVKWGNASNWSAAATTAGVPQDSTPKVGDVAWFSYGHVAWVDQVTKDKKGVVTSIDISEYNYGYPKDPYKYNTRSIKPTSVSKFIHFK